MTSNGAVRFALAAGLCLCAASAGAQQTAPQGMPGLLGRSPHQTLDVTVSAADAYDDNLLASVNQTQPTPEAQLGGGYQAISTQVQYQRKFHYASFSIGESSVGRYYPSLTESTVLEHAGVGAFTLHTGQTTLSFSQTVVTTPYYSYGSLPSLADAQPGDLPTKTVDQSVLLDRNNTYGSSASMTHNFGRRLSLVMAGVYQNTTFDHDATALKSESGSGRLVFRLTDGLGLVAGYGVQQGVYTFNSVRSNVTVSTINVGLDFNRQLSTSRRTALTVHTGTAVLQDSTGTSTYQLIGDARLVHRIGRNWHTSTSYTRGVALINGFRSPTLTNALASGLDGRLSRRLDVSMLGGYSRDQIGVAASDNNSNTFSGTSTLHVALSQLVKMSATYAIYSYRFDKDVSLPEGILRQFHRQELRFGIDVWLPLVR